MRSVKDILSEGREDARERRLSSSFTDSPDNFPLARRNSSQGSFSARRPPPAATGVAAAAAAVSTSPPNNVPGSSRRGSIVSFVEGERLEQHNNNNNIIIINPSSLSSSQEKRTSPGSSKFSYPFGMAGTAGNNNNNSNNTTNQNDDDAIFENFSASTSPSSGTLLKGGGVGKRRQQPPDEHQQPSIHRPSAVAASDSDYNIGGGSVTYRKYEKREDGGARNDNNINNNNSASAHATHRRNNNNGDDDDDDGAHYSSSNNHHQHQHGKNNYPPQLPEGPPRTIRIRSDAELELERPDGLPPDMLLQSDGSSSGTPSPTAASPMQSSSLHLRGSNNSQASPPKERLSTAPASPHSFPMGTTTGSSSSTSPANNKNNDHHNSPPDSESRNSDGEGQQQQPPSSAEARDRTSPTNNNNNNNSGSSGRSSPVSNGGAAGGKTGAGGGSGRAAGTANTSNTAQANPLLRLFKMEGDEGDLGFVDDSDENAILLGMSKGSAQSLSQTQMDKSVRTGSSSENNIGALGDASRKSPNNNNNNKGTEDKQQQQQQRRRQKQRGGDANCADENCCVSCFDDLPKYDSEFRHVPTLSSGGGGGSSGGSGAVLVEAGGAATTTTIVKDTSALHEQDNNNNNNNENNNATGSEEVGKRNQAITRQQQQQQQQQPGAAHYGDAFLYPDNSVYTNKYSLQPWTLKFFLYKMLWEQFQRKANLYFLVISVLQLVPGLSPTGRFTTVSTLAFVLFFSCVKLGIEDIARHRRDNETNNRAAWVLKSFEDKEWRKVTFADIRVGDIVRVENYDYNADEHQQPQQHQHQQTSSTSQTFFNTAAGGGGTTTTRRSGRGGALAHHHQHHQRNNDVPCDLVLLTTSEPDGTCYIETSNLDGETNFKQRRALRQTLVDPKQAVRGTKHLFEQWRHLQLSCEHPNGSLYKFSAKLQMAAASSSADDGGGDSTDPLAASTARGSWSGNNINSTSPPQRKRSGNESDVVMTDISGRSVENSASGLDGAPGNNNNSSSVMAAAATTATTAAEEIIMTPQQQQQQQLLMGSRKTSLIGCATSTNTYISNFNDDSDGGSSESRISRRTSVENETAAQKEGEQAAAFPALSGGPTVALSPNTLLLGASSTNSNSSDDRFSMSKTLSPAAAAAASTTTTTATATGKVSSSNNNRANNSVKSPVIVAAPPRPLSGISLQQMRSNSVASFAASGNTSTMRNTEGGALSVQQTLYRGCSLRKAHWAIGICVFTGHETKVMQNARETPHKVSRVERMVNTLLLSVLSILLLLCVGCTIGAALSPYSMWYASDAGHDRAAEAARSFLTFLILFNNFIPISLYVSIEFIKFAQGWFIGRDLCLYHPKKDMPAVAKTTDLNEELGQIDFCFTDKTGTLTQNVMSLLKFAVNGVVYGEGTTEIGRAAAKRRGVKLRDPRPEYVRNGVDPFWDRRLTPEKWFMDPHAHEIRHLFFCLAVCHTVIVDNGGTYEAESPDEEALVRAAARFDYELVDRSQEGVALQSKNGAVLGVQVLDTIDFTPTRKRMSVLIRHPDTGVYMVVMKGADTAVLPRINQNNTPATGKGSIESTQETLDRFAEEGLRTFVVAHRVLEDNFAEEWLNNARAAREMIGRDLERDRRLMALASMIEQDMELVGVAGIEDKLQDRVPETIDAMRKAGISVWMMTGDKRETAINIGFACSLLHGGDNMTVVNLFGKAIEDRAALLLQMKSAVDKLAEQRGGNLGNSATDVLKKLSNMEKKEKQQKEQQKEQQQEQPSSSSGEQQQLKPDAELAAVVDGFTLAILFSSDESRQALYDLASNCSSVICCRVSPKQKADVVQLMRDYSNDKFTTLAVGDGANDVPMIQAAHVGVGISGMEGQQAANSADFAVAQFRHIHRLVMIHGRANYTRLCLVINYSFYKNALLVMTQFWYCIFNLWSGQSLYEQWILGAYNVAFTFLPIIIVGIFDRDVLNTDNVHWFPRLYTAGIENAQLNIRKFVKYLAAAVMQSAGTFFVVIAGMWQTQTDDGRSMDLDGAGFACYVAVIVVANMQLALMMNSVMHLHYLTIGGSLAMVVLFVIVYSALDPTFTTTGHGAMINIFFEPIIWLFCVLGVVVALLPTIAIECYNKSIQALDEMPLFRLIQLADATDPASSVVEPLELEHEYSAYYESENVIAGLGSSINTRDGSTAKDNNSNKSGKAETELGKQQQQATGVSGYNKNNLAFLIAGTAWKKDTVFNTKQNSILLTFQDGELEDAFYESYLGDMMRFRVGFAICSLTAVAVVISTALTSGSQTNEIAGWAVFAVSSAIGYLVITHLSDIRSYLNETLLLLILVSFSGSSIAHLTGAARSSETHPVTIAVILLGLLVLVRPLFYQAVLYVVVTVSFFFFWSRSFRPLWTPQEQLVRIVELGIVSITSLIGLAVAENSYRRIFKSQVSISQALVKGKKEQQRSLLLLKNIMPSCIVDSSESNAAAAAAASGAPLGRGGKLAMQQFNVAFDTVSVVTSDVVTNGPAPATSKEVHIQVELINLMANMFDTHASELGIEKIGSFGDAWTGACGIPVPDKDHAKKVVVMGLKMLRSVQLMNKQGPPSMKKLQLAIRVGAATGKVQAGIVGRQKLSYEIFGPAVDEAQQMEATSKPNRLQVSHDVYELTYHIFEYRVLEDKKGRERYFVVDNFKDEEWMSEWGALKFLPSAGNARARAAVDGAAGGGGGGGGGSGGGGAGAMLGSLSVPTTSLTKPVHSQRKRKMASMTDGDENGLSAHMAAAAAAASSPSSSSSSSVASSAAAASSGGKRSAEAEAAAKPSILTGRRGSTGGNAPAASYKFLSGDGNNNNNNNNSGADEEEELPEEQDVSLDVYALQGADEIDWLSLEFKHPVVEEDFKVYLDAVADARTKPERAQAVFLFFSCAVLLALAVNVSHWIVICCALAALAALAMTAYRWDEVTRLEAQAERTGGVDNVIQSREGAGYLGDDADIFTMDEDDDDGGSDRHNHSGGDPRSLSSSQNNRSGGTPGQQQPSTQSFQQQQQQAASVPLAVRTLGGAGSAAVAGSNTSSRNASRHGSHSNPSTGAGSGGGGGGASGVINNNGINSSSCPLSCCACCVNIMPCCVTANGSCDCRGDANHCMSLHRALLLLSSIIGFVALAMPLLFLVGVSGNVDSDDHSNNITLNNNNNNTEAQQQQNKKFTISSREVTTVSVFLALAAIVNVVGTVRLRLWYKVLVASVHGCFFIGLFFYRTSQDSAAATAHGGFSVTREGGNLVAVFLSYLLSIVSGYTQEKSVRQSFAITMREHVENRQVRSAVALCERLLANSLPRSVIRRMRADPTKRIVDEVDDASILFVYLVGQREEVGDEEMFFDDNFALDYHEIVEEINEFVFIVDILCEYHGVEKIKSVPFVVASGVPEPTEMHYMRLACFARDVVAFSHFYNQRHRKGVLVKAGMHCGRVTAGVLGTKRFSYDVFGDTVTTASDIGKIADHGSILCSKTIAHRLQQHMVLSNPKTVELKKLGRKDQVVYTIERESVPIPVPTWIWEDAQTADEAYLMVKQAPDPYAELRQSWAQAQLMQHIPNDSFQSAQMTNSSAASAAAMAAGCSATSVANSSG